VARGQLARAVLGNELLDTQHANDKSLPNDAILVNNLEAIRKTEQWTDHAAKVGAGLLDHLKKLSADTPVTSSVPNQKAERDSRSALPFGGTGVWEPAAANHRLRWRAYLADLAERTADDHWYDENQSRYFQAAADRYVADANRLAAELRKRMPQDADVTWDAIPSTSLAARLAAPPLSAHEREPIAWTSELSRTVSFNLGPSPKGYPEAGRAVAVRRLAELNPIKPAGSASSRPMLPISGGTLEQNVDLQLDVAAELSRPGLRAACTVYFRGQRPTQEVTINLNRRPELVVAEPPPAGEDRHRMVAVRADHNVELGSVVILLDYSDSMRSPFQGQTRKQAAHKAVADLLKNLPKGTPLRIRVFSDEKNEKGSRLVFGTEAGDDRPRVTWDSNQDPRYKDLVATLDGIKPYGWTPLVQSIIDAVKNDFDDLPGEAKTLLVLTDGTEQDGPRRPNPQAHKDYIAGRAKVLADNLAGENIALHVVQFALSKGELAEADDLFRPLQGKRPEMVRLWPADNANNLLQALLDAIRPKLKLTDRFGVPAINFPQTGLPSRADDRPKPPYSSYKPHWSKWIADDADASFQARAYPNRLPKPTDLVLRHGERMILGFANQQGRGTLVRRELYADYFRDIQTTRRGDDVWALSIPRSAVDEYRKFHSLAYLEQVPPHRRDKGDRNAFVETLQFAAPQLTWWQVTPSGEKGKKPAQTGTVNVTRHYGYPAPAWKVTVENWPHDKPPAEVKVWAADTTPGAKTVTCRLDEPQELPLFGGQIKMRAALEPIEPGSAEELLVVRFTFDKGKPIQAHPVGETVGYPEHRYYGDGVGADGMTAYTAKFRLKMSVEKLRTAGVELMLIPVQPSLTRDNLLTLPLPDPIPGTLAMDSKPEPSDSKK
jgi:hypothetical protein